MLGAIKEQHELEKRKKMEEKTKMMTITEARKEESTGMRYNLYTYMWVVTNK